MSANGGKRIRTIREGASIGGPVLYVMSRDQRVDDNWALAYAQELALEAKHPLVVACPIAADYPNAPQRQLDFMLAGLMEVKDRLSKLNIVFLARKGSASSNLIRLTRDIRAGAVVCDFNPLRESRRWKTLLADGVDIPVYEVDTHNIVPVWEASVKQEYGAYTIRPRINRLLPEFLTGIPRIRKHSFKLDPMIIPKSWSGRDTLKPANSSLRLTTSITPGEKAARRQLKLFLNRRLGRYDALRNDPTKAAQSDLSPYLHFGQLSAQRAALEAQRYDSDVPSQEAFLEELIVRRELSDNFCYYNERYDSFDGFPSWAQRTLNEHRSDPRPYLYSRETLESADTHDELWNAAQTEMIASGKMHGYMRMYWAKKILEWTATPEDAIADAIYLNDKYELDGNDPNGYTGIAWSIGGVHDRAWSEREIFGKIRYMSYGGCKRKFPVADYVHNVATLKSEVTA